METDKLYDELIQGILDNTYPNISGLLACKYVKDHPDIRVDRKLNLYKKTDGYLRIISDIDLFNDIVEYIKGTYANFDIIRITSNEYNDIVSYIKRIVPKSEFKFSYKTKRFITNDSVEIINTSKGLYDLNTGFIVKDIIDNNNICFTYIISDPQNLKYNSVYSGPYEHRAFILKQILRYIADPNFDYYKYINGCVRAEKIKDVLTDVFDAKYSTPLVEGTCKDCGSDIVCEPTSGEFYLHYYCANGSCKNHEGKLLHYNECNEENIPFMIFN